MFKFNSDNIFAGYIKQLLASFNLPKYKVYTNEQRKYHNDFIINKPKNDAKKAQINDELTELYTALQLGTLPYEEVIKILARIKELNKEYAEIPTNPELNVLVSAYRNKAIDYDDNELELKAVSKEIDEVTERIVELTDLLNQNSPEYSAEELANLQKRLEILLKKQESIIIYPTDMRYIPYIKDGDIQIYAPQRNGKGEFIYTDKDWKKCHGEYGKQHWKLHKESDTNLIHPQGYAYGIKIQNYTKNLEIQNNIYDTYTHEYLGDYLRFQRDYRGLNLMPLYNCFSNTLCPHLKLEINVSNNYTAEFNTNDKHYKIYMVPIKLFQKYTIAIDCEEAVEMCCGLFGKYQYEETYSAISAATYMCFNNMQFKSPKLFDKALNLNKFLSLSDTTELGQREGDLKLFIKLPADNKSSIVVLEGNYVEYSDSIWLETVDNDYTTTKLINKFYKEHTTFLQHASFLHKYFIAPFVAIEENKNSTNEEKALASKILTDKNYPEEALKYYEQQLEQSKISSTVYDKLVIYTEELFGKKSIGNEEKPRDGGLNASLKTAVQALNPEFVRLTNHTTINFEGNYEQLINSLITPLQLLRTNTDISYPFADRLIEYLLGNVITPFDEIPDNIERVQKIVYKNTTLSLIQIVKDGIWKPALQLILYNYINENYDSNDINHDILGYVDKDVEARYSCIAREYYYVNGVKIMLKTPELETISSSNIYSEAEWED